MPRTNVSFQTSDNVTLRDWFFTPSTPPTVASTPLLYLILTHGFSCVKEMDLSGTATPLTTALTLSCLVYDHRGFGASDTLPNQPRQEAIPYFQCADMRDAITFATTTNGIDKARIGLWGYSYAGGHVLYLRAVDRRVSAVHQPRAHGRRGGRTCSTSRDRTRCCKWSTGSRWTASRAPPASTSSRPPSVESHAYFSAREQERSS